MKSGKEYWDLHHKDTIELFKTRPQWMKNYDNDYPSAVFIRGLIADFKPQNILEIGTAAGWAAYYMLEEAIKHNQAAQVSSLDFSQTLYYAPQKPIGAAFKETAPELYSKWTFKTGLTAIEFVQSCNEKYDFVFIDACHTHPWAALDFLTILPLLKDNAVVVFHDVYLNEICLGKKRADRHPDTLPIGKEMQKGPNVVYNVFKDEMVLSYDDITPNCAAMIVSDKQKTLKKIFKALETPWEYQYTAKNLIEKLTPLYFQHVLKHFGNHNAKTCKRILSTQLKITKIVNKFHNLLSKVKKNFSTKNKVKSLKHELKNKKALLWGASNYLEDLIRHYNLNCQEIIGIIDRDPQKTGTKLGKYTIYTPDDLKALKPDIIIPTAINHTQIVECIEKALNDLNISAEINQTLISK